MLCCEKEKHDNGQAQCCVVQLGKSGGQVSDLPIPWGDQTQATSLTPRSGWLTGLPLSYRGPLGLIHSGQQDHKLLLFLPKRSGKFVEEGSTTVSVLLPRLLWNLLKYTFLNIPSEPQNT